LSCEIGVNGRMDDLETIYLHTGNCGPRHINFCSSQIRSENKNVMKHDIENYTINTAINTYNTTRVSIKHPLLFSSILIGK